MLKILVSNGVEIDWQKELGKKVTVQRMEELETLVSPTPFDGLIIGDWDFSVNSFADNHTVRREHNFLRRAMDNIPVLGISFGAHLIAHLNGGAIETTTTRQIKWANVLKKGAEGDPLFGNCTNYFRVFKDHWEEIAFLPDNAILLASSADIQNEAFRLQDKPVWGVQFRPEVSVSIANEIVNTDHVLWNHTPEAVREAVISPIAKHERSRSCQRLLQNFLEVCRQK